MKVLLKRIARRETYTIGRLYIDGEYVCDTLEDKDRGLKQTMTLQQITSFKVYGKTAIPTGEYIIRMDIPSPKYCEKAKKDPFWKPFCNYMPRIESVKGFSGILMHAGNTDADTFGCVLVGENSVVGKLTNSRTTFVKVFNMLFAAYKRGEKITLEIK